MGGKKEGNTLMFYYQFTSMPKQLSEKNIPQELNVKKIGNLRVLQCFISSGQKEFQQGVELFSSRYYKAILGKSKVRLG